MYYHEVVSCPDKIDDSKFVTKQKKHKKLRSFEQ